MLFKIIGVLLGYHFFGIFGAVLGYIVGSIVDRYIAYGSVRLIRLQMLIGSRFLSKLFFCDGEACQSGRPYFAR